MTDNENKIYSKCKKLSDWNSQKIYYHFNKTNQRSWKVKRGEVYYIDLGENIGSEQGKARPCVIVQADALGFSAATCIIAIISNSGKTIPDIHIPITGTYNYKENGVDTQLTGTIDFGHIRSIAKERILFKICALEDEATLLDEKLLNIFGLSVMMKKKDNRISFLEKRIKTLQDNLEKFSGNKS